MRIIRNFLNDNIIQNSCMILTILLIIGLTSCSGARSIRTGSNVIKTVKKTPATVQFKEIKKEPEIIKPAEKSIEEETEKTDYSKLAEIVGGRLPTLREQMQNLADSQDTMRNDISKIQNDINEIKNILNDMNLNTASNTKVISKYPETGKSNITEAPSSKPSTQLLSDENISKKRALLKNKMSKNINEQKDKSENIIPSEERIKNISKPVNNNNLPVKTNRTDNKNTQNSELSNDSKLMSAKDLFGKKNYLAAIDEFSTALNSQPEKSREAEINYYLGECYYFINENEKAIEYLNKVLTSTNKQYMDAARIRKAEANLKAGKISAAKEDYQALIKNHPGSSFIPKARKMLQQL